MEAGSFAGLSGVRDGGPGGRAPLVLLHGLTFDHAMWRPALAAVRETEPGRQVLALDLPGHGGSPAWPSYDIGSVAAAVHEAVAEARLRSPVLVGHSIGALIATMYAARYPASGVINVDQWLQAHSVAALARPLAGEIRGGDFAAAWQPFEASMHMELLPGQARRLLRSSRCLRQDLVAGYWRELLDTPVPELASRIEGALAAVRGAAIPYLFIAGHQVEPWYRDWLSQMVPGAAVEAWPRSGHFPHLAHPRRFARRMAATARWGGAA
jgi:pimeloyl-ACP methyl ester carboxylesterase